MKVADFFCGAGGFSEGFRQAGFDVIFAVDKWAPAVETHRANHPNGQTILGDIIEIAKLSDEEFNKIVPDTEVIIGSPPCVAFSNSNKSGKGDKTLGIKLLESYLKIIARKMYKENSILKYWILENVPNIQKYIKDKYSAKDLGLEGKFELKVIYDNSGVYNAKYYGVASNRKRFLCGNFPTPQKLIEDDIEVVPIKKILNCLREPNCSDKLLIKDPNFDYSMKSEEVTDHHYICEIAEFEWKKAKRLKQDKGYMGKMAFPENIDKPARTIMATMSASSRESFILPYKKGRYRLPTVREVASIMSFPIDYRFYAVSKGLKYRMVGNAVPPKLSLALAKGINNKEGVTNQYKYSPIGHDNSIEFYNLNGALFSLNSEKRKKMNARFKYHIPYLKLKTYRVELTNYNSNFKEGVYKWDVEIHKSQGKDAKVFVLNGNKLLNHSELIKKVRLFSEKMALIIDSFYKLQQVYCLTDEERKELIGPFELLEEVRRFIDVNSVYLVNQMIFIDEINSELPAKIVLGYIVLKEIISKLEEKE